MRRIREKVSKKSANTFVVEYGEVEVAPEEKQRRVDVAFDVLFKETLKTIQEQLL